MKFNFLNLHTNYSYIARDSRSGAKIGQLENNLNDPHPYRTPCFANYFSIKHKHPVDTSFTVLVYTKDNLLKDHSNNYCMLKQDEMVEYLEIVKRVVDFSYEILPKGKNRVAIQLEFRKTPIFHTKWVVSCVRSLYEYPSSFALKEAMYFKDHPEVTREGINFFDLFNVILQSICHSSGDQTVIKFWEREVSSILSIPDLKKQLDDLSKQYHPYLNDIYERIDLDAYDEFTHYIGSLQTLTQRYLDTKDIDKVMYGKNFKNMRLKKVYIPFYKKLRNK